MYFSTYFGKMTGAGSDSMRYDTTILEFDKIKERIRHLAQSEGGKRLADDLSPTENKEELEKAHGEIREALVYVKEGAEPSFSGLSAIAKDRKHAAIGGLLETEAFLRIRNHIDIAQEVRRTMRKLPDTLEEDFRISEFASALHGLKELRTALSSVFDEKAEIRDDASKELKSIRKRLWVTERRIRENIEATLKKEKKKLTEELVTIRHDRYVIPVKASDKNSVKGTILDYSASGETVYIEPESVRAPSAEKLRLQTEEAREIEKILRELSRQVAENDDELRENDNILAHLDFLFAKTRYGHETDASVPIIAERISLLKARHPLIEADEVVANNITFDADTLMMVITGSNTGGKTVTLKTIGLLHLMAQSGLMIPAMEGSRIRVFSAIRADIGDEQSLEQSLSTFSSHMKRIVDIIDNYDDNQLVLLDELGTGTDPKEGSSLAMSILDFLSRKESIVVATTHYPELKAYAYTKDHIMNASVEFDEETLQPTYRLLLRTPGESHAFLIGERLGLKAEIVERAKQEAVTAKNEVSHLIDKLKKEAKKLDSEIKRHEELNRELEEERKASRSLKKTLQEERQNLREKLAEEKDREMREKRREAERLIEELEGLKTKSFKEHELAEKKHEARLLAEKEAPKAKTGHDFRQGDRVIILKYNRPGELLKKQKEDTWLVKMGNLKSVFSEDELEYAEEQTPIQDTDKRKAPGMPQKRVASKLDLRGERVAEARERLEKFLDDCAFAKQPYATIIHGYGTLALRKMVKEVVEEHPVVKRHRDGETGEGGQGATVVHFE